MKVRNCKYKCRPTYITITDIAAEIPWKKNSSIHDIINNQLQEVAMHHNETLRVNKITAEIVIAMISAIVNRETNILSIFRRRLAFDKC